MLKKIFRFIFKTTLYLLLLSALLWGCSTSWFLSQVALPFVSLFIDGNVSAKTVELSFKNESLRVTKGSYKTDNDLKSIFVDTMDLRINFKSLLTDSPFIYNIDLQSPQIALRSPSDEETTPQNDEVSLNAIMKLLNLDQFKLPNITCPNVNIHNGKIKINQHLFEDLQLKINDFSIDSKIKINLATRFEHNYYINIICEPFFDSMRHFRNLNLNINIKKNESFFNMQGLLAYNDNRLTLKTSSECKFKISNSQNIFVEGRSKQAIEIEPEKELIYLKELEAALTMNQKKLFSLSSDSTLVFNCNTKQFIHNNQVDLLTLDFNNTPITAVNFLFNFLKLDSEYQFTEGLINGKLFFKTDPSKRLFFRGNLKLTGCSNISDQEFNLDRARAEFEFTTWYDFNRHFDININHLTLFNHGSNKALMGDIHAKWNNTDSILTSELELSSELFDAFSHLTPQKYAEYAPTFLADSTFKNAAIKLKLNFEYDVAETHLHAIQTHALLHNKHDSLMDIDLKRKDTDFEYMAKITVYPTFLHPIIMDADMPNAYQYNIDTLMESRKSVIDLNLYLDLKNNEYILNNGIINLYSLVDTRPQVFTIRLDSEIDFKRHGEKPIFFTVNNHIPAFDASRTIPTPAEGARIFCNYFFNENTFIKMKGRFELYPISSLIIMHEISAQMDPRKDCEFLIYLDQPLENFCATDLPATDLVIASKIKAPASIINPALKNIKGLSFDSGNIYFDNTYVFSFINNYFAIQGENKLENTVINYNDNLTKPIDLKHRIQLLQTDTLMTIDCPEILLSSQGITHIDALYSYEMNQITENCSIISKWRKIDHHAFNIADNLLLNSFATLQNAQAKGMAQCQFNQGKIEYFATQLNCDSILFINNPATLPPLNLNTEFAFKYKDSLFHLQAGSLEIKDALSRKLLTHLNAVYTLDSQSKSELKLHSDYMNLPTVLAFYDADSQHTVQKDTLNNTALPNINCNVELILHDLEVINSLHLKTIVNLKISPLIWTIYESYILYKTQKINVNATLKPQEDGELAYNLEARAPQLDLQSILPPFLGNDVSQLKATLHNVLLSIESKGFKLDSFYKHMRGNISATATDISLPLETHSMWLKIFTTPLILSSSINQLPSFSSDIMNAKPHTDKAEFKEGIIILSAQNSKINIEEIQLKQGVQIYNLLLNGQMHIPSCKFKNLLAIVKPIAISIFAFKIKNTLQEPEISAMDVISQTLLHSLLFYTNPQKVTNGLNTLSEQVIPINPINFFEFGSHEEISNLKSFNESDSSINLYEKIPLFNFPKIFPFQK